MMSFQKHTQTRIMSFQKQAQTRSEERRVRERRRRYTSDTATKYVPVFGNSAGFSLLEVILAISLLAIIGVMTINIIANQLRMRTTISNLNNNLHILDRALARVAQDIRNSYLTPDVTNTTTTANRAFPRFYAQENDLIFFTGSYTSLVRDTPESNLAAMHYMIENENSKKKLLVRVVDTDMVEPIENKGVGTRQVLLSDLKEFSLTYWDGNTYRKTWDSSANDTLDKLPKLVKIKLSIFLPRTGQEEQMAALHPGQTDTREVLALETLVFLSQSAGQVEANSPTWSEYKWQ